MNLLNIISLKNADITVKKALSSLAILFALTFSFYGSSIGNDYNLDDEYAYTNNKNATQGLSNISAIFTDPTFQQADFTYGYRPITTLSFALENELFGINSAISHFINVFLYATACYLILLLIISIFPDRSFSTSLAIAILFVALPIHSEIANNIKCRDELLMLVFSLTGTLLWIKSLYKKWWLLIPAFVFLGLGILSKKTGIIFLGIIPSAIYFHPQFSWKKLFLSSGLLLFIPLGLKIIKKLTKEGKGIRLYGAGENPLFDTTIEVDQIGFSLHSLWFYIKKMPFTTELISYYGYNTIPIDGYDITTIITCVVILLFFVIALKGLKDRNPISFGIIIMAGGLLPLINWLVPLVGIVAERFATIASIGLCIFVCFGVAELLQKSSSIKKPKIIGATLLISYLIASFPTIQARNKEWKNKETLFLSDVKKAPNSAILNGLAGKIYLAKIPRLSSDRDKINMGKVALNHLQTSVNLAPDKYLLTDLGSLQFRALLEYNNAINSYSRAIKLDSTYPDPHFHLGWVYLAQKDTSNSIAEFEKTIEINASYIAAYEPLLKQLVATQQYQKALDINEKGLKKHPKKLELVLNQANIYYIQKDAINALLWLRKYQEINQNNQEVNQKAAGLERLINS